MEYRYTPEICEAHIAAIEKLSSEIPSLLPEVLAEYCADMSKLEHFQRTNDVLYSYIYRRELDKDFAEIVLNVSAASAPDWIKDVVKYYHTIETPQDKIWYEVFPFGDPKPNGVDFRPLGDPRLIIRQMVSDATGIAVDELPDLDGG